MSSSYYQDRLLALGVSEEYNSIPKTYTAQMASSVMPGPLFSEDKEGNIVIHYYTPVGGPAQYRRNKGNKWSETYTRTRLKPGSEIRGENGSIKYLSPKGSGLMPYFTPKVIRAYLDNTEINTLHIIEGEFKAIAGDLAGGYFVGLPGIHGFYGTTYKTGEGFEVKTLHIDLSDLILRCKIRHVVYVQDSDALTIQWQDGKELTNRPVSFYTAVRNFRRVLKAVMGAEGSRLERVGFSVQTREHEDVAKGLDDLLEAMPEYSEKILQSISTPNENEFFRYTDLSDPKDYQRRCMSIFGLTSAAAFYHTYRADIGSKIFKYRGGTYKHTPDGLELLSHEMVNQYVRIGADWYRINKVRDHFNKETVDLRKWKWEEIKRDLSHINNWEHSLRRFRGFVNEPNYSPMYEEYIDEYWNLAAPCPHSPAPGEWKHIEKFLQHLFPGEATPANDITGDLFTVILDWFNVALHLPKAKLPVIILVSKDNNTGKSSFLKFVQAVFGTANSVILDNESFKTSFNAHYISKNFILIDESFLDQEKKSEKERLKQMVTSPTAQLQHKGVDTHTIPFHGRLCMTSNDEMNVMQMGEEEDRWFVVKVKSIPKAERDPKMFDKMELEIPAFLHFLWQRRPHHEEEDRLWFNPKYYLTAQFRAITERTRSPLERNIREWLKEKFIESGERELMYDVKYIHEQMAQVSRFRPDINSIRNILKENFKLSPVKQQRVKMVTGLDIDGNAMYSEPRVMRPYLFRAFDFLTPEEYTQFIGDITTQSELEL